jgi:tetratricopeptide (TPR) repeat protein
MKYTLDSIKSGVEKLLGMKLGFRLPGLLTKRAVDHLRQQAFNALAANRFVDAELLFRKIEDMQPGAMGNGHNIGVALMGQERYEEAERLFAAELENFGDAFHRFKTLADLYYVWGRPEQAAEFYAKAKVAAQQQPDRNFCERRAAISSNPARFAQVRESIAANKRGAELYFKHEIEPAMLEFKRAGELDPTNFQSFNNLGAIELNNKKDAAAAAAWFEKAAGLTSLVGVQRNFAAAKAEAERVSKEREKEILKKARKEGRLK